MALNDSELKALDTFGNCKRPVFSIGVPQHMHRITKLWTSQNNERKNTVVAQLCVLSDAP